MVTYLGKLARTTPTVVTIQLSSYYGYSQRARKHQTQRLVCKSNGKAKWSVTKSAYEGRWPHGKSYSCDTMYLQDMLTVNWLALNYPATEPDERSGAKRACVWGSRQTSQAEYPGSTLRNFPLRRVWSNRGAPKEFWWDDSGLFPPQERGAENFERSLNVTEVQAVITDELLKIFSGISEYKVPGLYEITNKPSNSRKIHFGWWRPRRPFRSTVCIL